MKDYLHDPDDRAHLEADVEKCRDCANYVPSGMMGWASSGRIHGKGEGWCLDLEMMVRGDIGMDGGCPFYEGRP
jgi:hypothetical protein